MGDLVAVDSGGAPSPTSMASRIAQRRLRPRRGLVTDRMPTPNFETEAYFDLRANDDGLELFRQQQNEMIAEMRKQPLSPRDILTSVDRRAVGTAREQTTNLKEWNSTLTDEQSKKSALAMKYHANEVAAFRRKLQGRRVLKLQRTARKMLKELHWRLWNARHEGPSWWPQHLMPPLERWGALQGRVVEKAVKAQGKLLLDGRGRGAPLPPGAVTLHFRPIGNLAMHGWLGLGGELQLALPIVPNIRIAEL